MATRSGDKKWRKAEWSKWAPADDGESVEGVFLRIDEVGGPNGTYSVVRFKDSTGKYRYSSATTLVAVVRDFSLQEGDELRFLYRGKAQAASHGGEYGVYELYLTKDCLARTVSPKHRAKQEHS